MYELIQLAGAIALLLWAIRMVRTGFERAYKSRLENAIRMMTKRRLQATTLGAIAAAAFQSGTAVVLLAAGFVATGALGLIPALALSVGAEIGSSLMAMLLSFDLSLLSPILLLVGYITFQKSHKRKHKYWGRILMGLGLLLLALSLVANTTSNMRSGEGMVFLTDILAHDPFLTLFLLAIFTWLVHSSLAVILIITHLVLDGAIAFDTSMIMVLGANIGGALPALSSGWGVGAKGRLVIIGNLIIRSMAVVIGLLIYLINQTGWLPLESIGLASPMIFHVTINIINGAIFLCMLSFWAEFLKKYISPNRSLDEAIHKPMSSVYLSQDDINHPVRAMANVTNETLRIADIAYQMLENSPKTFRNSKHINRVKELDDDIDNIHREVTYYLSAIKNIKTASDDHAKWQDAFNFVTNLEHVGDIIDASLMVLARKKHKDNIRFSEQGESELRALFLELLEIFRLAQAVYVSKNPDLATELIDAKHIYRNKLAMCREQHTGRIRDQIPDTLSSIQIHMDILRDLQRICSLLVATAYPIIKRYKQETNNI
ncbi:Na/Pi cotransporter family protein [Marinomonas sp. 15G1-11]|uniref:Na/Pi cotransporter family protein n=1 Tax=Marinomonas phaeophyticola TaxID=3004091 RepID=A0ABT4JTA1_9GAMM|nr:Na/Pi cotransporter family protein [Marinomonas sp. 15G1-11]MCZ2721630.1 Na/Pi cotransporter family protein [Marinomonas sp. 15G1-11]